MSKENLILNNRKWFEYSGIGALIYLSTPFFYLDTMGIGTSAYLKFLLFNIPLIGAALLIGLRLFGSKDYRFRVVLNIVATVMTTSTLVFLMTIADVFNTSNFTSDILTFVLINSSTAFVVAFASVFTVANLTNPFKESVSTLADEVRDKNYQAKIKDERVLADGVFSSIAGFVNQIVSDLGTSLEDLTSTGALIAATAEELASSAEEVNASAEEVSSTSQAMSNGATTQTELITEVSDEIKQTTKLVDEIIASIRSNTNQVSQIALQTNILALNAGIEASRAGDYGRGFAVVAENIRKLSDQSKTASEGITEVADEIATRLEEAFNKISATMLNVVSVSEETAASAEEVAAAAEEVTASMEEVTSLSQELTERAELTRKID